MDYASTSGIGQLERIHPPAIPRGLRRVFEKERSLIPRARFHELGFVQLEPEPVGQIRNTYERLGLPDLRYVGNSPVIRWEAATSEPTEPELWRLEAMRLTVRLRTMARHLSTNSSGNAGLSSGRGPAWCDSIRNRRSASLPNAPTIGQTTHGRNPTVHCEKGPLSRHRRRTARFPTMVWACGPGAQSSALAVVLQAPSQGLFHSYYTHRYAA